MNLTRLYKKLVNKHFLSLAGNGSMAALSVFTYAILYRLLPENEMGNWIFFQTIFALLDAVRTGFLQTAFIKFYSGAESIRQKEVAGSTWFIAILLSVFIAVINIPALWIFNSVNDAGVLFFLKWFGISILLTCAFNVTFWILQADERFDRILILRIINQGSFVLCLAALYLFDEVTLNKIIYYFLGCSFISSLVPLILGWSRFASLRHRKLVVTKEIVAFGRYSMGTYLCSTIFKYSDSIIIKFLLGPAALAVYNLAQRLLEIIEIPIRSFLATAMPSMSVAFNRNQPGEVSRMMKKYAGTLTVLLLPIIVVVLIIADPVVAMIGGGKYIDTEAANILRIFMLSAIFFPIDRFSGITLDIIHKPHLNFIKIILSLVINVITDLIAIRLFGNVYGVAAASIITLLFGVAFGYYYLNRYLPFTFRGFLTMGYHELRTMLAGLRLKKVTV